MMIREQFEQILRLNNTLLNRQRELKKVNAELNQVNRDLSNRLVRDPLTGLLNRYQYRQAMELKIAQRPEHRGILVFIDIDDFKSINDLYGHAAGDRFLVEFARRLNALPYPGLIAIRIAGDEFGLYLHGYEQVEQQHLEDIWDAVSSRVIKEPIDLDGVSRRILCSVGMGVYGEDTSDIYQLIEFADFAMYESKESGKNSWRRFDAQRYAKKKLAVRQVSPA